MAMSTDQQCVEDIKDFCQSEYEKYCYVESNLGITDYAKGKKKIHQSVLDIIAKYE